MASGQLERSHLFEPEEVSLEGLDSVKQQSPNWTNPQAAKIAVEGPKAIVGNATAAAPESEPRHELSRQEILERIGRLEPKYRKFLDTAAPLMTEHEVSDFLQLDAGREGSVHRGFLEASVVTVPATGWKRTLSGSDLHRGVVGRAVWSTWCRRRESNPHALASGGF